MASTVRAADRRSHYLRGNRLGYLAARRLAGEMTDRHTGEIMTDYESLAAGYIRAWNERDPAARRAAIGEVWAADGRYTDPLIDVQGVADIDAAIAAAQGQFPGFVFRITGTVDGHHSQCRFSWELGPAG